MTTSFNRAHYQIAPLNICIADVHAKAHTAGNTVHSAWEHFADADGCDRVDHSAGAGSVFNRQDQLCSRTESVAAVGHQNAAGMSARSLNQNAETRRRGNFRNNSERNLLALQQRPLFNVQFEECLIVASRQSHLAEFARKTSSTANLVEHRALIVF